MYNTFGGEHYFTDLDGVELEVDTQHGRGQVFLKIRDEQCGDVSSLMLLSNEQVDKLIEVLAARKQ